MREPLLSDKRSREAVEIAERFADGSADEKEMLSANREERVSPGTPEAAAFLTAVRRYDRPSMLLRFGIVEWPRGEEAQSLNERIERICLSGREFPADAALAVAREAAGSERQAR